MSKSDFNFDYSKVHKPPLNGRKPRMIALFAGIALLTCGGIYWLLPKAGAEPDPAQPKNPTELHRPPEGEIAPGSAGGESSAIDGIPKIIPVQTPDATTVVQSAGEETPPQNDPDVGESEKKVPVSTPGAPDTPAANDPAVGTVEKPDTPDVGALPGTDPNAVFTVEPIKGKPHPADPVKDEPRIARDAVPAPAFDGALRDAQAKLAAEPAAAREIAHRLLSETAPASRQWRAAAKVLSDANWKLLTSGDGKSYYTVKPGDNLYKIAAHNGISVTALRQMNRFDEARSKIFVGQKLLVGKAEWNIVINKSERLLKLYDGKMLFAVFDVGIGRAGKTPVGEFRIGDKITNPPYHAPDGRIIAPGAPDNELGRYFLKLFGKGETVPQGYGIHGTADESTVTKSYSNGCLRMRNREIEKLFTLVPTGTTVVIEK